MSSQKQVVTVRDLVEEAKKRIVILVMCVVGLSYIMSLTSSSVWVNLPAAACLIILLRYFSLDIEMKRKTAAYNNSKPSSLNAPTLKKSPELPKAAPRSDWRSKVNSQVVEDAIDHFTRHLISEWVLDLWYSRITPDKQGPEELVFIINGVLGEISRRFRNVNLIDLLTRDLIDIICRHVELFRECQAKIERQQRRRLSFEDRDSQLRRVMATEDKLHPALFSPESEHKVLQHIVNNLISLTFRPEDLHCGFFHYTVRELLACCVIRPVLNLANPRFINERIEGVVVSRIKTSDRPSAAQEASQSEDLSNVPPDHFSRYMDPSVTGVELVQLKSEQQKISKRNSATNDKHVDVSKDPLLSMDTRSSRSWNSLPSTSKIGDSSKDSQGHRGGQEWSDVLDMMSQRKTETLAPEHLESMWAKGRNYKKKEGEKVVERVPPRWSSKDGDFNENNVNARGSSQRNVVNTDSHLSSYSSSEGEEEQTKSCHSHTSEDDETVTGLNSPGTRVWDGRTKKNLGISHIHHPLENSGRRFKKTSKGHERDQHVPRHHSGRKRSRISGHIIDDDDSDDTDDDSLIRSFSGMSATSSASYVSVAESDLPNAPRSSLLVDSFVKLRCEVLGANVVKGSSKIFAVYSIAVTDESNHSWSIKRRFRHFEELHRRLKVFPEYNLHLPPKHFLSAGVDIPVIQERCVLLDEYIKKLLQLQRISGSIEVWDFLNVDSQTYSFSSSFSIIETLTVKPVSKTTRVATNMANITEATPRPLPWRENMSSENGKSGPHVRNNVVVDDVKPKVKILENDHIKTSDLDARNSKENAGLKVETRHADDAASTGLPTEWVPPKLTLPLLDLVDVVFQLHEGGWIRRKAFWVAKQMLQLGMGDALDDWVVEKICLLRRGTVVASGIQRVEQILWPDGIFMTKHPKRQQQSSIPEEEQKQEAERRAKFVHELMIEKAPATIVSLIGQKEYEQCAEDLYFFLQSSVCLKQLAYDLLEMLLLSAFPEMEQAFKQLHYEKHLFGQYTPPN